MPNEILRMTLAGVLLFVPATAHATWSVIAVDLATKRVVIASATCVNNNDTFLPGVQAVVVPGIGVAACQASVDNTHTNQMLVFNELKKGTDPAEIIRLLSADPAFQSRQFGILDLKGRSAGHSGLTNGYVSQDIQGQVPGTQIFYSIQGNILRPGKWCERRESVSGQHRRDHRSRDGRDGSGGCGRRRQPMPVSAAARGRLEAREPVHREDRARGLHPDE
jgi:hypothetical protein